MSNRSRLLRSAAVIAALVCSMLAGCAGIAEQGSVETMFSFAGSWEDEISQRAIFEDAGVAEAMDEAMYDPLNRLAWENLRDHTLTMGNDENVG